MISCPRLVAYRSSVLGDRGVPHLFTTRRGPDGEDFDLTGMPAARVARVLDVLEVADRAAGAYQVHGNQIVTVDRETAAAEREWHTILMPRVWASWTAAATSSSV